MTNAEIRHEVEAALASEGGLQSNSIQVAVEEGVATLAGRVPSYVERCAAEKACLGVIGVSAVANELIVDLPAEAVRSDQELAALAIKVLAGTVHVPPGVKLVVEHGFMTLVGEADWPHEKAAAEEAVANLVGVRGITNEIQLAPQAMSENRKDLFLQALRGSAVSDASHLHVEAVDDTLVLSGTVPSWADRDEAVRLAWSTPGVRLVECRLGVRPMALTSH